MLLEAHYIQHLIACWQVCIYYNRNKSECTFWTFLCPLGPLCSPPALSKSRVWRKKSWSKRLKVCIFSQGSFLCSKRNTVTIVGLMDKQDIVSRMNLGSFCCFCCWLQLENIVEDVAVKDNQSLLGLQVISEKGVAYCADTWRKKQFCFIQVKFRFTGAAGSFQSQLSVPLTKTKAEMFFFKEGCVCWASWEATKQLIGGFHAPVFNQLIKTTAHGQLTSQWLHFT